MRFRRGLAKFLTLPAAALLSAPSAHAAPSATAVAPECDRACLTRTMDGYFDALVRHDASGLPFDRDARFTENTVPLTVGKEGLWISASEAPGGFRIDVVDVPNGAIGAMAVMKAWGNPVLVSIRLKLVNGRITEVEHVVTTNALRPKSLENLGIPRPEFLADVPAGRRSDRQQLANIADSYFEAAEHAQGSLAPFAPLACGTRTACRPPPTRRRSRGRCRWARRKPTRPWHTSARSTATPSSTLT